MAFLKTKNYFEIWREFRRNLTDEQLMKLCETEFEEIISGITEEAITSTVEQMQKESREQVAQIKNKMQKEINNLRIQQSYQQEEFHTQKLKMIA